MKKTDALQRFLFEHANIRGEIAYLEDVYQTIISQRSYPPMVKQLLGEALVSCLLLVGSIKFEGELSLQFQGDKRLPLLIVQCTHQLHIRAFAQYQEDLTMEEYAAAFLKGKMVLTINQYQQTQSYQSTVSIQSTSMSENLMYYFAQSEQIASHVWLAVDDDRVAGLLIQLMPEQATLAREQFWEYAVHVGQTVTEAELLTLDNATLLYRLYHETELRLFEDRAVYFRCRCNEEKMKQVLVTLGKEDAEALLQEKGKIEISCEFCNKEYVYDAIDVALLFHQRLY